MKYFISFLLIVVLFSSCTRKTQQNNSDPIQHEDTYISHDGSGIITEEIVSFDSRSRSLDFDIEYIYMSTGLLNIDGFSFENIIDFIKALNFYEDYSIFTERLRCDTGTGYIYRNRIISENYELDIYGNPESSSFYYLAALEIKITENNFLHLFPYTNMEDYLYYDNFREFYGHDPENEYVSISFQPEYFVGSFMHFQFRFKNGELYSIELINAT